MGSFLKVSGRPITVRDLVELLTEASMSLDSEIIFEDPGGYALPITLAEVGGNYLYLSRC